MYCVPVALQQSASYSVHNSTECHFWHFFKKLYKLAMFDKILHKLTKNNDICLFIYLIPTSVPSPPLSSSSFFPTSPLQKRAGLPWIATGHSISSCSKTSQVPSSEGQKRQPRRRNKRALIWGRRQNQSEWAPAPSLSSLTRRPRYDTL